MARRYFGNIRKLPSGRYQASYKGPDGKRHTAPSTFDSRVYADAWLARVHGDIQRGQWQPPIPIQHRWKMKHPRSAPTPRDG